VNRPFRGGQPSLDARLGGRFTKSALSTQTRGLGLNRHVLPVRGDDKFFLCAA
jgi:hypothetical protein